MEDTGEELFKIDIEADEEQNEQEWKPEYLVDHFMIQEDGLIVEEINKDSPTSEKCWNCDKIGHSLRECPLPHNRAKINQAKKSFMAQAGSKRYHDNKFAKFRPGHISEELRHALGLRHNELPMHIYTMRVLGYPPGWLHEAKISNSGIKMYNDRGKRVPEPGQEDGEILNKIMKYDVEKLIEYPGFNIKISKNIIDEHKSLGFPSMRSEHKLKNYIKYLEEISNREEDMSENSTDDEVIDMDLSEMLHTEIIDEVRKINKKIDKIDQESNRTSDTLEEGEISSEDSTEKEVLLPKDNLEDNTNQDNIIQETSNTNEENDSTQSQIKRSQPIDVPVKLDENDKSTPRGSVTSTSFGTPHCKSHSPYASLPAFENFNKDISDVIDFENLPDSVGKYDSMCSIISKIRNYMTSKVSKTEEKPAK